MCKRMDTRIRLFKRFNSTKPGKALTRDLERRSDANSNTCNALFHQKRDSVRVSRLVAIGEKVI